MSHSIYCAAPSELWNPDSDVRTGPLKELQLALEECQVLERRLLKGVNIRVERGRYAVCCERIESLAHMLRRDIRSPGTSVEALTSIWSKGELPALNWSVDYTDLLAKVYVEQGRLNAIEADLFKTIVPPSKIPRQCARLEELAGQESNEALIAPIQALRLLKSLGWGLIEVHSATPRGMQPPRQMQPEVVINAEIVYKGRDELFIMERFLRQGLNWGRANEERLREEVRLALQCRRPVNVQNQGHEVTTRVLSEFVMAVPSQAPGSIPILYRDGSEAKPFPLRRLKPPTIGADQRTRLPIALMSMRHIELDWQVHAAWFRNVEGSGGETMAEDDRRLYEISLARLAELKAAYDGRPLWIQLFHTGLETAIIGFYRALVESLIEDVVAEREPWVIVEPTYYDGVHYRVGRSWPTTAPSQSPAESLA